MWWQGGIWCDDVKGLFCLLTNVVSTRNGNKG